MSSKTADCEVNLVSVNVDQQQSADLWQHQLDSKEQESIVKVSKTILMIESNNLVMML